MKKGQFFSLDVLFAAGIFLLVLLAAMNTWSGVLKRTVAIEEQKRANEVALVAAQQLASSAGVPSSWHLEPTILNVKKIGVAGTRGEFDRQKLLKLEELNATGYKAIKEKLGVGEFELYVSIESNFTIVHEFGAPPPAQSQSTIITRLGHLSGAPAKMRVIAWK